MPMTTKVTFRPGGMSGGFLITCIFSLLLFGASEGGRVVFPDQEVHTLTTTIESVLHPSSPSGTIVDATLSKSPVESGTTEGSALATADVTSSPQMVNVTSPLSNISVSAVLQLKVPQPNVLNYDSIQALGINCYPRDTCLGSTGGRGSRFPDQHTAEHNCFCDQICAIYNDCCIDSPFRGKIGFTTVVASQERASFTCIHMPLLGRFYIKSTCPANYEYISEQTRANCELDPPESDPMRSIPVTAGSFTYKNAFCAQCNGVPSHEWVYWNTRLQVVRPEAVERSTTVSTNDTESISTAEIVSQLANMSQRFIIENLVFVEEYKKWSLDLPQLLPEPIYFEFSASPPEYVTSTLRPCFENVIDYCPSEYHNRWVINACASYQARVYKSDDATVPPYRNVHCALCHGLNTFSEVACIGKHSRQKDSWSTPSSISPASAPGFVESSFSILFDISATQDNQIPSNQEVATTVGHSKPCDSKFELYDPFRKKCRSLLCGLPDAQVIDGTCAPIQQSTTVTPSTTTASGTTTITNTTSPSIDTNTSVNVNVSTVSIIDASEGDGKGEKSGSVGNSSLVIAKETVILGDSSQTTSPPDLLTQVPTVTTPADSASSSSPSSSSTDGNLDSNTGHIDNSIVGQNEDAFTTIKTIGDTVASTTSSPLHLNSSTKLAAATETSTTVTIASLNSFDSVLSNSSLPTTVVANSHPNSTSSSPFWKSDSNDTLSITGSQLQPVAVAASNSSNMVNNSGNTSIIQEETTTKDTNGTMDTVSETAPTDDDGSKETERQKENQFLGQQVVKNRQNLSSEFINCTKINLDLTNGTYTSLANGSFYLIEYDKVLNFDEYLVIYQNESLIHLAICSTWLQLAASHASLDTKNGTSNNQVTASDMLSFDYLIRKLQSTLTFIGISVSIICLMLHLITFSILPEMRNLSGKNLASLATYLLVGYTCFLTRHLAPFWLNDSPVICKVIGITMYHTFISSFTWSAILSFDVWRSLNLASTELRLATGSQNVRFTIYSLVSIFISSTVTLIVVTKSLSPSTLPMLPTASFNPPVCWFSSSSSLITYFIIPVTVILVFNCCFFASISLLLTSAAKVTSATFNKSKQVKKASSSSSSTGSSTTAVHASTSSATHSIQNDSKLYLKLSILMGLTWILGLIGTLVPNALIWLLFILLNTTQGLFIFCSFTLTEKVKRGLNDRITKSYIVKTLGHRLTTHGHTSTASNLSSSAGKT